MALGDSHLREIVDDGESPGPAEIVEVPSHSNSIEVVSDEELPGAPIMRSGSNKASAEDICSHKPDKASALAQAQAVQYMLELLEPVCLARRPGWVCLQKWMGNVSGLAWCLLVLSLFGKDIFELSLTERADVEIASIQETFDPLVMPDPPSVLSLGTRQGGLIRCRVDIKQG